MDPLDSHVILTGKHGELTTPPADVDAMVQTLVRHGKGVLHFHGGLVSKESGLRAARNLLPVYEDAGAYPIFVVWNSDVLSILRGNLGEIAREEIFKRLLKTVLRFSAGHVKSAIGAKATGSQPASPRETDVQLKRLQDDEEPFDTLAPAGEVAPLSRQELSDFAMRIGSDESLLAAVASAVGADGDGAGAKGIGSGDGTRTPTKLDPEAIAELRGGETEGSKAIFESAILIRKATSVLTAVVGRYRGGRDHGLYATVFEEILREFYLGAAGEAIWATMKRETLDTFAPVADAATPRGGARLLDALGDAIDRADPPDITVVGHSTGAVFINNLMATVDSERSEPGGLPAEFRFRRVVFLAPACTFADFAALIVRWDHLWDRFRMFTMTDAAERADRMVRVVYPHSLLYFVSGLLERGADGESEAAKPLVGLERWVKGPDSDLLELSSVREYLADHGNEIVWSPVEGGPGLSAAAKSHGAFDEDPGVHASLKVFIGEP